MDLAATALLGRIKVSLKTFKFSIKPWSTYVTMLI